MRPLHPFTPEWAAEFRSVINSDADYRDAAKGWVWTVAFVLNATPVMRAPQDIAAEFSLEGGNCIDARVISATEVAAAFVLRADYGIWRSMARGLLDPVLALASRQIHLTGSVADLIFHAKAVRALVGCAQRVPTWFPDER